MNRSLKMKIQLRKRLEFPSQFEGVQFKIGCFNSFLIWYLILLIWIVHYVRFYYQQDEPEEEVAFQCTLAFSYLLAYVTRLNDQNRKGKHNSFMRLTLFANLSFRISGTKGLKPRIKPRPQAVSKQDLPTDKCVKSKAKDVCP